MSSAGLFRHFTALGKLQVQNLKLPHVLNEDKTGKKKNTSKVSINLMLLQSDCMACV